jgi:hypothetical protein
MTRAELVKISEVAQKNAKRNLLPLLAYVVALAVFLWWANFHREIISERVSAFIFIIGFVGMYGFLILAVVIAKNQRRRLGCCCPQCKKELLGGTLQLAIASGRCGRCGAIILEDWNN